MGFQTFLAVLLCIVSIIAGVAPAKYPQYTGIADFIFWVAVAVLLVLIAAMAGSNRKKIIAGVRRLTGLQFLLLSGIVGTWVFLTITLCAFAWTILYSMPATGNSTPSDEGPLAWLQGFSSMEGGMNGFNDFALKFQGANISKESVELKSAHLTSLIDGTRLDLEIIGNSPNGESKVVAIDKVQLIAPGAPIELVAKFGPPDPNAPGKILGLEPKIFLEKWRQFAFDASDNKRVYHFDVNENAFMVFFKGKVGPRVTLKPDVQ